MEGMIEIKITDCGNKINGNQITFQTKEIRSEIVYMIEQSKQSVVLPNIYYVELTKSNFWGTVAKICLKKHIIDRREKWTKFFDSSKN